MVKLLTVAQANQRFARDNNAGLVCVFAGATSGTGAGTIEKMAIMMQAPIFYVLGRSAARFATQRAKLESLNPSLEIIFLEAEVSLISDIDAVSKQISAMEQKVDYLYMSQGCIPLNVPQFIMRLVANLLPLLRRSLRPRVLSVLNGGREKSMRDDDIGLENARNFGSGAAINHTTTMMTLALEYLAENDKNTTFIHSFPGLVATDNFSRLAAPESFGFMGRVLVAFVGRFVSMLQYLFGISAADAGARQAFLLTSNEYGPGEVWRINEKSDPVTASGVLEQYREHGWRAKVWEYTVGAFEKALVTGN